MNRTSKVGSGTTPLLFDTRQFLVIVGPAGTRRSALLDRALQLCRPLVGTDPSSSWVRDDAVLMVFARNNPLPPSAQQFQFNGPFLLSAGTPVALSSHAVQDDEIVKNAWSSASLARVLREYDGQFCFITSAGTSEPLFLITDPLGQFHVYISHHDGYTFYSTSALLLGALSRSGLLAKSIREFVGRGNVFEHRTLFEHVHKIPGGTIKRLTPAAESDTRNYWRLQDVFDDIGDRTPGIAEISTAMTDMVGNIHRQFSAPVFDLTGGFDSRILVGAALQSIPSGSLNTAVAGAPENPDVVAAERIAGRYGLHHRRVGNDDMDASAWWAAAKDALLLTDGEYDILEYANIFSVQSTLRREFSLSINGSGGGLLQGYWWELLSPHVGRTGHFDTRKVAGRRLTPAKWIDGIFNITFDAAPEDHFEMLVRQADEPLQDLLNTQRMDNILLSLRIQRWQGRIASSTSRVQHVVSPFLLRPVLREILNSAPELRHRGKASRAVLEKLDPDLARLPLATGLPASPITAGTAYRFVKPAGRAMFHSIHGRTARKLKLSRQSGRNSRFQQLLAIDEVRDLLNLQNMHTRELFRPGAFDSMVALACRGDASTLPPIGRILTLEYLARTLQEHADYRPRMIR